MCADAAAPIHSFAPIVAPEAKVLILGTMPGKKSLELQQYYGHPRNAFWPILFALFAENCATDYECRKNLIRSHGLALWDVLQHCRRPGSMDADIQKEVPNDFGTFLRQHESIHTIYFNGNNAHRFFRRHVGFPDGYHYAILPSTSPAYARIDFAEKLQRWRVVVEALKDT